MGKGSIVAAFVAPIVSRIFAPKPRPAGRSSGGASQAERDAAQQKRDEEARAAEEAKQGTRGNRGSRALFSGSLTGFDTLSPRGFFRTT